MANLFVLVYSLLVCLATTNGQNQDPCFGDIVFVMDESGSIGTTNFDLMKDFLSQLVSRLDIDRGNTRVGLVTFSTNVRIIINLNDHSTAESFRSAIQSINYPGGNTNTAAALALVRTRMLTSAAGDRSNIPNVVVVLTDGASGQPDDTKVEAGKLKNLTVNGVSTKVVALGIGDQVDVRELEDMASKPADRNVIRVQDFSKLRDVEEELRNTSCPSSTSPSPRPPPRPTPPPPGPPSTSTPAPAPPPQTECPADVIFVLDESESISAANFNQMKSFLSTLVSRLDIDRGNTRVGIVTFSSGVRTTINLNAHSSVASLQSAISSLSYARGSTNTAAALAHVRTRMLTSAAGDRSNVSNVVVVLTDGGSDDPRDTQMEADRLKSMAVNGVPTKVVALGIGSSVNEAELNNIVSAPADRNVILAPDFSSLSDVEEQLRITSCPPPPSTDVECPVDVIFVLDESESIGPTNFNRTKSFLSELVSRLNISSGHTRVGLVTFSSNVGTTINLDAHSSVPSLRSAISSLGYARGSTNTAAALEYVRTRMLTSAAGDRSNASNVVVLLTDGGSDDPRATQMAANRLKRLAKVVVLGIGSGVNQGELENIASAPVDRNVIRASDFSRLSDVEEQLRNTSCEPPFLEPPPSSTSPPSSPSTSPPPPIDCPADIIFVVDASGSIGSTNFDLMKSFLSQLVSRLDIDSGNTRVGLVTFSDDVRISLNLNAQSSVASFRSAISSLTYPGGGTNTAAALADVRTTMLTSAAGDRSNVPNVVVVLTDGGSADATATQTEADMLKRMAKVVVLGIGSGVSLRELNNIASAPIAMNVIRVHNFSSLSDVEEQLRNTSCIQPPTGPSPSSTSPSSSPSTAPPPIDCPADIIFVVDESGSIRTTNFNLMKSFLSRLVSRLDIDSGNTRVGLVTFSDGVGTTINLNAHSSVASFQSAISSLTYPGGGTNTAAALEYVRTRMLTSAAGDRNDVSNVVVVLTDGGSANPTATQMQADQLKRLMRVNGITTKVVALGIGSGVNTELNNIASPPVNRNVIIVRDFSRLGDVEDQLRNASCAAAQPIMMNCSNDIVFVVDESGSIGSSNFGLMKRCMSRWVSWLDIDRGNTRVGLITYSDGIGTSINLNAHLLVASLQRAISSLNYTGGGTNPATALAYVRTTMLTSAAGDRSNVPNVVVILTDGGSHNLAITQREVDLLKGRRDVRRVVAVGIGDDVRLSELHIMASPPHSLTVIVVPDFSNLTKADVEKDIMRAICAPLIPPADYPRGWVYLKSARKYYRAIFELMDWNKADTRCREFGTSSRLVDINDAAENLAIKEFIASVGESFSRICEGPSFFGVYQGYWTSGQRMNSMSCSTQWVWKTYAGSFQNVTYTDWHAGEPNCVGGRETCLQLTTPDYLEQRWADVNCGWVLCPLCELDL